MGTAEIGNPATLVAIIVAARRAGNRELEREMRRQLHEQFCVKLSFVGQSSKWLIPGKAVEPAKEGRDGDDATSA